MKPPFLFFLLSFLSQTLPLMMDAREPSTEFFCSYPHHFARPTLSLSLSDEKVSVFHYQYSPSLVSILVLSCLVFLVFLNAIYLGGGGKGLSVSFLPGALFRQARS
ncbi:hypothetical protein GGR50DRAFT_683929 [Xylaria sp. CBS 124048]|nr:hypothetical protein GGR50DRAFT_683929 [Xylaria sp. CBS 124048]